MLTLKDENSLEVLEVIICLTDELGKKLPFDDKEIFHQLYNDLLKKGCDIYKHLQYQYSKEVLNFMLDRECDVDKYKSKSYDSSRRKLLIFMMNKYYIEYGKFPDYIALPARTRIDHHYDAYMQKQLPTVLRQKQTSEECQKLFVQTALFNKLNYTSNLLEEFIDLYTLYRKYSKEDYPNNSFYKYRRMQEIYKACSKFVSFISQEGSTETELLVNKRFIENILQEMEDILPKIPSSKEELNKDGKKVRRPLKNSEKMEYYESITKKDMMKQFDNFKLIVSSIKISILTEVCESRLFEMSKFIEFHNASYSEYYNKLIENRKAGKNMYDAMKENVALYNEMLPVFNKYALDYSKAITNYPKDDPVNHIDHSLYKDMLMYVDKWDEMVFFENHPNEKHYKPVVRKSYCGEEIAGIAEKVRAKHHSATNFINEYDSGIYEIYQKSRYLRGTITHVTCNKDALPKFIKNRLQAIYHKTKLMNLLLEYLGYSLYEMDTKTVDDIKELAPDYKSKYEGVCLEDIVNSDTKNKDSSGDIRDLLNKLEGEAI